MSFTGTLVPGARSTFEKSSGCRILPAAVAARGTPLCAVSDPPTWSLKSFACVRGAVQCLYAFEEFRKTHEHGQDTGIKLGLFTGACYVVTANDTIDYFGQTVNCASVEP